MCTKRNLLGILVAVLMVAQAGYAAGILYSTGFDSDPLADGWELYNDGDGLSITGGVTDGSRTVLTIDNDTPDLRGLLRTISVDGLGAGESLEVEVVFACNELLVEDLRLQLNIASGKSFYLYEQSTNPAGQLELDPGDIHPAGFQFVKDAYYSAKYTLDETGTTFTLSDSSGTVLVNASFAWTVNQITNNNILLSLRNHGDASNDAFVSIDSVTVTAIPEPATIGLLLGLLPFVLGKRGKIIAKQRS